MEWVIVGWPRRPEAVVRSYAIDDGRVTEVEIAGV